MMQAKPRNGSFRWASMLQRMLILCMCFVSKHVDGQLYLYWVSEYEMWVRGTDDGCKDTTSDYDHYCYEFIGALGEDNGDSTPYSNVSGWELSRSHYEQNLDSAVRTNCNALSSCGWTTFSAENGLSTYCNNNNDDWFDTTGDATDVIYLYSPEYCKMGYELSLYTASGTGCYPLNQGTPLYACSPCAVGYWKEYEDDPKDAQVTCALCLAGRYAPTMASSGCLDCGSGQISVDVNGNAQQPYSACQDCPGGKIAEVTLDVSSECTSCPAGKFTNQTTANTICTTTPAGYYTVEGSASYFGSACTAGYYGSEGSGTEVCTGECAAGYYCPATLTDYSCAYDTYTETGGTVYCGGATDATQYDYQCDAGYYGGTGQSASSCTAPCPAGFYCYTGTVDWDEFTGTCYTDKEPYEVSAIGSSTEYGSACMEACGGSAFYCPSGSSSPKSVDTGYYTIGTGKPNTTDYSGQSQANYRTDQAICPEGYYCDGGIKTACPGGAYGDSTALTDSSCSGLCAEGYYCPEGSTSKYAQACGSAAYYCPEGSEAPTLVQDGYYSGPITTDATIRYLELVCSLNELCLDGAAYDYITFDTDGCPSTLSLSENEARQRFDTSGKSLKATSTFTTMYGVPVGITYSLYRNNSVNFFESVQLYLNLDSGVADGSDYGETSTLVGGTFSDALYASDVGSKGSLYFDGSTYVETTLTSFHGVNARVSNTSGTIAFFVRPSGWSGSSHSGTQYLASWRASGYDGYLYMRGTALECTFGGLTLAVSEPRFVDGIWTHVAVVMDPINAFFGVYVETGLEDFADGDTVRNEWGAGMYFFDYTILGSETASASTNLLTGYLDEFVVFGTALVDAEIELLATAGVTIADAGCDTFKQPMKVYERQGWLESIGEIDYSECSSFYMTSAATSNHTTYKGTRYNSSSAYCVTRVDVTDTNDPPVFQCSYSTDNPGTCVYNVWVAEQSDIYTNVGSELSQNVTDLDPKDSTFFSMHLYKTHGDDFSSGLFDIETCSGQIYIASEATIYFRGTPTRYYFNVTVKDDDGASDYALVIVNIRNVNDAPTILNPDPTYCYAQENKNGQPLQCLSYTPTTTVSWATATSDGHSILNASDPDYGDTFTWAIVDSNKIVRINNETGNLTLSGALDYESRSVYSGLVVTVFDAAKASDYTFLTLTVLDTNDNPTFTDATLSVDEDASVGTMVADLSNYADDEDTGDYASSLMYSLSKESDTFNLTNQGELYVKATSQLDYETGPRHFSLSVLVSDAFGGSVAGHVAVNVTNVNEDPYMVRNQTFYIDEDVSIGTSKDSSGNDMLVEAKDPDNMGRSFGVVDQTISFVLKHTKVIGGDLQTTSPFGIAFSSGLLSTQAELDYETVSSYVVNVYIQDSGCDATRCPGSAYGNVTVMVNDVNEAPEMTQSHGSDNPVYINESAPAGTPVAYLFSGSVDDSTGVYKVYDLDSDSTDPEGNELGWNITSDYGMKIQKDPSTNLTYIVTGEDTILNYEALSGVDYQFTVTLYAYEVETCNNAPLRCDYVSNSIDVVIQVLDNEEAPTMSNTTSITVQTGDCQTPCYTKLLDLSAYASDPESQSMTYNLTHATNSYCSTTCTDWCDPGAQGKFYISGSDLYVRDLPSSSSYGPLLSGGSCAKDSCTCPTEFTLTLDVWASDGRYESNRVPVHIVVSPESTDKPTISSLQIKYIDEDIADGSVIRIPWSPTYDTDYYSKSDTAFSLETTSFDFIMNSTNGWLTVNTGASIDFETTSSYNFTVSYTDSVLDALGTLRIKVRDVNEAPSLPSELLNNPYSKLLWVYENETKGYTLSYHIAATDPDSDDLGKLRYSLSMDDPTAPFAIRTSPQAGSQTSVQTKGIVHVTNRSKLDYETTSSYTGWLNVTDAAGLENHARITIYVYDVNEPPHFAQGTFYYDEDDRSRLVGELTPLVTDPEGDTFTWTIDHTSPYDGSVFSVVSGAVDYLYIKNDKMLDHIDYENVSSWNLTITVTEATTSAPGPKYSVQSSIVVHIRDVNDMYISSISPDTMQTAGGQQITITGGNFGPTAYKNAYNNWASTDTVVTAKYLNGIDNAVYWALNCSIWQTNTKIVCDSNEGVGYGHYWNVTVNAPEAEAWSVLSSSTTSYAKPEIINVTTDKTGAKTYGKLNTVGGDTVYLWGTNLGPVCDVTCPPVANDSRTRACGGECVLPDYDCKYAPYEGSGGVRACDSRLNDNVRVYYGYSVAHAMGLDVDRDPYECDTVTMTNQVGDDWRAPWFNISTQLSCQSAAGFGGALFFYVYVAVESSIFSTSVLSQFGLSSDIFNDTSVAYKIPTISYVSDGTSKSPQDLTTQGSTTLTIVGTQFGPAETIDQSAVSLGYGRNNIDTDTKYEASNCYVPTGGAHTTIYCDTVAGVGKDLTLVLTVKGQDSSLAATSYSVNIGYVAPTVTSVRGAGVSGGSTAGGSILIVEGEEFGPVTETWAPNVTYGPTGREYQAVSCYVSSAFVTVSCVTGDGTGANHSLIATVGAQDSALYDAGITYGSPTVATLTTQWESKYLTRDGETTSRSGSFTRGGEWVLISGINFGSVAENAISSVTYGPNGNDYLACSTDFDERNPYPTQEPSFAPSVASVTVDPTGVPTLEPSPLPTFLPTASPSALPTLMPTTIPTLNLQPTTRPTLSFTPTSLPTSKPSALPTVLPTSGCGCRVVTSHYLINCTTVSATGIDHYWKVTINKQISTAPSTDTEPPYIDYLSGDGTNSSFGGGEIVTISGSNFGQHASTLESVTYGPSGSEYTAAHCALESQTRILCKTVDGLGSGMSWLVTVDGQSSEESTVTTTYHTPTILNMSRSTSITDGGVTMTITGRDFGLAAASGTLVTEVIWLTDSGSTYTSTAIAADSSSMLSDGSERLVITVPEMEGYWHKRSVYVQLTGDTDATSSNTMASAVKSFNYSRPTLDSLETAVSDSGSSYTDLILNGANFGLYGSVVVCTMMFQSTLGEVCTEYTQDDVDVWGHTEIEITAAYGSSGNVTVYVGSEASRSVTGIGTIYGWASESLEYNDYSPLIRVDLSSYYPSDNDGPFRTDGMQSSAITTRQTLTMAGYYFQDTSTALNMDVYVENPFGTEECPSDESKTCSQARITSCCTAVTDSSISTGCSLYSLYSEIQLRTITFEVPEGTGTSNMVSVVSAGQTNFANNCTVITLDYGAPVITSISSSTVPTTGGTVTLTGYNFGPQWDYDSSDWAVKLRGTALTVSATGYNHTMMSLAVPAGQGIGGVFSLTVDGQSDTERNFLGYSAPTITSTSVSSTGLPTRGQVVTITGTNFGTYGVARTKLSPVDYECSYKSDGSGCLAYPAAATYAATHTTLYVTMPKGQGRNTLAVNVSGQTVSATIDYGTPTLEKLTPSEAGTAGGTILNLTGTQLGIGSKYVLSLGTDSDGNTYCSRAGSCDKTLEVLNYTDTWITFLSPAGQSNGALSLSLRVCANADDVASDGSTCFTSSSASTSRRKLAASASVTFTFKDPYITYLAAVYEPSTPSVTTYMKPNNASTTGKYVSSVFTAYDFYNSKANEGCIRNSEEGCFTLTDSDRDSTSGGYTVVLKGSNFGSYDQVVYWAGVDVTTLSDADGDSCTVCKLADGTSTDAECDDETIKFVVPQGVGDNIPVYVMRGSTQSTTTMYYSYDPPYITDVSPSTPDAQGDVLYIQGQNFGPSESLAGSIKVTIGGVNCTAVSGASIWQSDSKISSLPYILCNFGTTVENSNRLKVGYQNVSVSIAKQVAKFTASDEVIRTACTDGYFGQEAWTPYVINGDIGYDLSDDYDIDDADDKIQRRNPYPFFPYESCEARNQYTMAYDPYLYDNLFVSTNDDEKANFEAPYMYYNMKPTPLECMQKGGYNKNINAAEGGSFTSTDDYYEDCDEFRRCLMGFYDVTLQQNMNYTVINTQNEYCVACPDGATCDDANIGSLYPVEPYADEGYWRYEFSMHDSEYCGQTQQQDHESRAFCYDIWPCQPSEACTGGNTCKKGYTGAGCSECCDATNANNPDCYQTAVTGWTTGGLDVDDDDKRYYGDLIQYRFRRYNGDCVKCPDSPEIIIACFFSGAFFAGCVAYVLNKKKVNLGIIQIGVDYFQVLAMMSAVDVEWPNKIQLIFELLSAFKFDIGIAAPECLTTDILPPVTFRMKWLFVMLFPVSIGALFFMAHLGQVFFKFCIKHKRKSKDLNSHAHRMVAVYLYMFYFIYLFTVQTALDIFNCGIIETVTDDGGTITLDDGNTMYMLSYPEYKCYSSCDEGAEFCQRDYVPYAAAAFLIYGIGYPAYVAWVLLPDKSAQMSKQDQLLKAMGKGTSRETSHSEVWEWHKRFSRLYYLYKPEYTYWMLFILFRKLMLACIELLFRENVTFQLSAVLLNFFWAYVMHTRNHPYMSTFEYVDIVRNMHDDIEHMEAYYASEQRKGKRESLTMQLGHGGNIEAVHQTGVQKVVHSRMDVGGKYLWNWNSVEAVLLMSCVLVSVLGIMFSSEFVDRGDVAYTALAAATMIVVIGSLVYFFLVVWSEIMMKVSPQTLKNWHCKMCMETNKHHEKVKGRAKALSTADGNAPDDAGEDSHYRNSFAPHDDEFEMYSSNPLVKMQGGAEMKHEDPDILIGDLKDQVQLEQTVRRLLEENKKLKQQNAIAGASGNARAGTKKTKKRVGKAIVVVVDEAPETNFRGGTSRQLSASPRVVVTRTAQSRKGPLLIPVRNVKKTNSMSPDSDSEDEAL